MRKYNFIHPLLLAFFSKALYRDVARNWKGICIGYLLSLVALCSIPAALKMRSEIVDFLERESPGFVKQIPTIKISKGKVSIDRPEPYFIIDERTKAPQAIIDTTGRVKSLSGTTAALLLTKTELMVKKDDSGVKVFDLGGIENAEINRDTVFEFLDQMEEWLAVIIYPFVIFFSLLYRGLEVAIFTGFASVFSRLLKLRLDIPGAVRLSAMAVTPAAVLGGVLDLAGIALPHWPFAAVAVSFGYLVFGLKANSSD